MGIQRKPQKSPLELIENQPGRGEPGKSTQSRLPPPPPRSPPRASQPTLPSRTEHVDLKRRWEQNGKNVIETGRPCPTSEEDAHRAVKQQKVNHAPKPSSQLPCLVVNPWWMMHQSGTSMGALEVTSPRLWSKPFCFQKTRLSYEVLGGVRSSFTPKDFWAWYVLILHCCFFFFFFFEFITTRHMHLYFLFGVMLIPFFWFQGHPKYVQALGDDQLHLSVIGWWEEKEGCSCANLGYCWKQQHRLEEKADCRGTSQEKRRFGPRGCWETGWEPKEVGT